MLESESVRIGKCQNRKVSELESVRIRKCENWGKCLNFSKLESVRIGKHQNFRDGFIKSISNSDTFQFGLNLVICTRLGHK